MGLVRCGGCSRLDTGAGRVSRRTRPPIGASFGRFSAETPHFPGARVPPPDLANSRTSAIWAKSSLVATAGGHTRVPKRRGARQNRAILAPMTDARHPSPQRRLCKGIRLACARGVELAGPDMIALSRSGSLKPGTDDARKWLAALPDRQQEKSLQKWTNRRRKNLLPSFRAVSRPRAGKYAVDNSMEDK